jgi:histidinol dehydrogenase
VKILRHTEPNFSRQIRPLLRRYRPEPKVRATVEEIITRVEKEGDRAVIDLTEKFGGPRLDARTLAVSREEIHEAVVGLPSEVERALLRSRRNVEAFARRSLRKSWFRKNAEGAVVGERFDPLPRVGLYIPGGTAPLVSSAIMTATLAAVAEVPEIVAVTPTGPDGVVDPALLAALHYSGVTEIYRIGGAQAVAALALGTKTIRPVTKVFGPGSVWVVEAKRQLFGRVAVDLLPGPSEILVIADETARPDWIAADLLAQCEHGHGSAGILLTTAEEVLEGVAEEIRRQLPALPRQEALRKSLKNLWLVQVPSLAEAVGLANEYAAEHVSIATQAPGNVAASLNSSGAIFLGGISPVAAGDFLAGPSHELPTGGAGKSFPGLTVDQFQRRTSVVMYDQESLAKSEPVIRTFSEIEGLAAHGRSASIRLEADPAPKKARPKKTTKAGRTPRKA